MFTGTFLIKYFTKDCVSIDAIIFEQSLYRYEGTNSSLISLHQISQLTDFLNSHSLHNIEH